MYGVRPYMNRIYRGTQNTQKGETLYCMINQKPTHHVVQTHNLFCPPLPKPALMLFHPALVHTPEITKNRHKLKSYQFLNTNFDVISFPNL